jgi:hypothetical protein
MGILSEGKESRIHDISTYEDPRLNCPLTAGVLRQAVWLFHSFKKFLLNPESEGNDESGQVAELCSKSLTKASSFICPPRASPQEMRFNSSIRLELGVYRYFGGFSAHIRSEWRYHRLVGDFDRSVSLGFRFQQRTSPRYQAVRKNEIVKC